MSSTPLWLLVAILTPFVFGCALLAWGQSLPRRGDWLAGLGVLAQIAGLSVSWSELADSGFSSANWVRGWIGSHTEATSIGVGLSRDTLGLAFASLAALLSAVFLLSRDLTLLEKRPQRLYSGACLATTGTALCWLAQTPWTALTGLALIFLGGFITLGADWENEANAQFAARFARERTFGMGLAVLGGLALVSAGAQFSWSSGGAWPTSTTSQLGAWCLAIGLFLNLEPFPLLGWAVSPSQHLPVKRVLFAQVFPAIGSFALLIRMEAPLRAIGVLPHFGWIALASAILASLTGLLQERWQSSLSVWISGAFASAVAALSFSGPWAAASVLVSASCAAAVFGFASSLFELKPAKVAAKGALQAEGWAKVLSFLAAAVGAGFVGFTLAGGELRSVAGALTLEGDSAGVIAGSVITFSRFCLALLAFKLAWFFSRMAKPVFASWASVLTPLLLVIASMGWVWTGTLTGGIIPGDPDRVMVSLFDLVFNAGAKGMNGAEVVTASWMLWGSFVVAFATAYWTCRGPLSGWEKAARRFPRFSRFVSGGYGIDEGTAHLFWAIRWLGSQINEWVDQRTWKGYLPSSLNWIIRKLGSGAAWLDVQMLKRLDQGVRGATEGPAKGLQQIQNGNVQWYLFFAIGSGIAILLHFLTRGTS